MNRLFNKAKICEIVAIKINAVILISIYLHTYILMKYGNRYATEKIGRELIQSRNVFINQYLFTY